MSRALLLRTLSAAALSVAGTQAFAQSTIQGGGATQTQADWASEEALYNAGSTTAQFGTYYAAGSGTGQQALIQDDLTCDINKVTGANGGKCSGVAGGANTVHYAASDSPLTTSQTSSWATSTVGQSVAGNLIQLPAMGTSTAIAAKDTNITANGTLVLSDDDLCGIFSGLITDFSQITDAPTAPAPGIFTLVYRSDSSASTFLLTNHLAAVCNSSNTAPGVTFVPTTTFASLFSSISTQLPHGVGVALSQGVANYLSGLTAGTVARGIGALSPDWTSLYSKSAGTTLSNGKNSALRVAAISSGPVIAALPTEKNIAAALTHVTAGFTLKPPSTAAAAANPLNWVPIVQTVSAGYPIVGYSTFDVTQCYQDPTITAGIKAFLTDHYSGTTYVSQQLKDGLVPLSHTGATGFYKLLTAAILSNAKGWNVDIGDTTACAGLTGR